MAASRLTDPANLSVIRIDAGKCADITFNLRNPFNRSRQYLLLVLGIEDYWYESTPLAKTVGKNEQFSIELSICPPPSAFGSHDVQLRLLADGNPDDSFEELNLTVVVVRSATGPIDDPTDRQSTRDTTNDGSKVQPSDGSETQSVDSEAASTATETNTDATSDREREESTHEDNPTENGFVDTASGEDDSGGQTKVSNRADLKDPGRVGGTDETRNRDDNRGRDADDDEEADEEEAPEPEPKASIYQRIKITDFEPIMENDDKTVSPQVVSIRPGRKALIIIRRLNETGAHAEYVLQGADGLPAGSYKPVDPVHIVVDKDTCEIVASVSIGVDEPSGTKTFWINYTKNGVSASIQFVLHVLAIPKLSVGTGRNSPQISLGPGRKVAVTEIEVINVGNATTAYRLLSVAPDESAEDSEGPDHPTPDAVFGKLSDAAKGIHRQPKPTSPRPRRNSGQSATDEEISSLKPVYQPNRWEAFVEKEFENAANKTLGRQDVTEKHKVTLRRNGIWWFGWKEKHTFHVQAVPVTDASNNSFKGNVAKLELVRWRYLPAPWFVFALLMLLIMPVMGGEPDNLVVERGVQFGSPPDGPFFVFSNDDSGSSGTTIPVKISFDAPFYLRLGAYASDTGKDDNIEPHDPSISGSSLNDTIKTVENGFQPNPIEYSIHGPLTSASSGARISVQPVPLVTNSGIKLEWSINDGPRKLLMVHSDAGQYGSLKYDLTLPKGATVRLDLTRIAADRHVEFWLPQSNELQQHDIELGNAPKEGLQIPGDAKSTHITFKAGGGATVAELFMVTTDAKCKVICLDLYPTDPSPGGANPRSKESRS